MTTLRLVLGDQLNAAHRWFHTPDPDAVMVMMKVRSETDYVVHHAQKVLAIFAAMRTFATALQAAGHRVRYLRIGDADNRARWPAEPAAPAWPWTPTDVSALARGFGYSTTAKRCETAQALFLS